MKSHSSFSDYPAEEELRVRQHVQFLLEHIPKHKPKLKLAHINLFSFLIEYLEEEGVLEDAVLTQRNQGNEALLEGAQRLARRKDRSTALWRHSEAQLSRPYLGVWDWKCLSNGSIPYVAQQPASHC